MSLMRSNLFRGALFSGALFGLVATIPTNNVEMVHGSKNVTKQYKKHKQHKLPTYQDYLESTRAEDNAYLDNLLKIDAPLVETLKNKVLTLAPIEDLYHNAEHNRQRLKQSLIDEGLAYKEAYLEVYYELVKQNEQAKEDDAIAAVLVAML